MRDLSSRAIFKDLYQGFSKPISDLDCGEKCGPYNDYGVPVCCDIQILVPAAYDQEWSYLQGSTDLWQVWQEGHEAAPVDLQEGLQSGQVLIQCLGYQRCQRSYRSITCRAFPFYPNLNRKGQFSGLSYYREFREQCWIINNLEAVKQDYIEEFQSTFERLFKLFPETKQDYLEFSGFMRDEAAKVGETIVLLGFSGQVYLVDPETEDQLKINPADLDSFGPFQIVKELVFPDETTGTARGKHHG